MTSAVYNGPWPKLRLRILERDNYDCQIRSPACTKKATQVDHIVPVRKGGARYDPANLRAACRPCNAAWHRHGLPPSRHW